MDPDLTLHETAAILSLSKATLRRYTDQGKLPCRRTAGGQRRFKLSEVLALLEHQRREARGRGCPPRREPPGLASCGVGRACASRCSASPTCRASAAAGIH